MVDVAVLKAGVTFTELVSETHDIGRDGKVLCPLHDDHTPSCHIYPNGFNCSSCHERGDALDWLKAVYNLGTAAAIGELKRRAAAYTPAHTSHGPPPSQAVTFKPVAPEVLGRHRRRAARLCRIPRPGVTSLLFGGTE